MTLIPVEPFMPLVAGIKKVFGSSEDAAVAVVLTEITEIGSATTNRNTATIRPIPRRRTTNLMD